MLRIGGEGLERLRLAGLLHDVGKIGVSDSILHKPAALRLEEEDEMKEHVAIGHGILLSAELPTEAVWVLHHHERVDGTGYPNGLKSDQIPLESRIIAVADAFEAMTGTRPYRESLSVAECARGAAGAHRRPVRRALRDRADGSARGCSRRADRRRLPGFRGGFAPSRSTVAIPALASARDR